MVRPARSKRGDPVERPQPWTFEFGDRRAAEGWTELVRAVPEAADRAWVAITSDPTRTDDRQHQPKGSLATKPWRGAELPQWQYEVTGPGRIWYVVDVNERRLALIHASTGHPGATDRGKRRR